MYFCVWFFPADKKEVRIDGPLVAVPGIEPGFQE